MQSKNVTVQGKVQGVYYRVSAKQKADMLGVTGYVKNEPDGTVKLVIKGEDEAVNSMINWCKKGPALARVDKLELSNSPDQDYPSFQIKH